MVVAKRQSLFLGIDGKAVNNGFRIYVYIQNIVRADEQKVDVSLFSERT